VINKLSGSDKTKQEAKILLFKSSLAIVVFALMLNQSQLRADRPPAKPEHLHKISSDVVVGTVVRVYTHEKVTQFYKTTFCISEIAVEQVLKGEEIQAADRVYAKYYYKTWIGDGQVPPGWNGQRGLPSGYRIKVYLRGSKSTGFKVVEPNGFAAFPKEVELDREGLAVLLKRYDKIYRNYTYHKNNIESLEIKRVLVVQHLSKTINEELKKIKGDDILLMQDITSLLQKLKTKIEDLDRLDGSEYKAELESYRRQLDKLATSSG